MKAYYSESSALISECFQYRYNLVRALGAGRLCTWIMLNPSIGSAHIDDPTIRKCLGFSVRWGFAGIEIVNLFAFRSPDPGALARTSEPIVGADNDYHIEAALERSRGNRIVCAWGNGGELWGRGAEVFRRFIATDSSFDAQCLGVNKTGHPKHPLYLPYSTPLRSFSI